MDGILRKFGLALVCVVAPVLGFGCGESPTGVTTQPLTKKAAKASQAQVEQVQVSDGYVASTSKEITDTGGGVLEVWIPWYDQGDGVRLATAWLEIPDGALGSDGTVYQIGMEAHSGTTLGDVQLIFTPSGTSFSPAATLGLVLIGDVDESAIQQATHLYGDGQIEAIETNYKKRKKSTTVKISVPGFSRYGFDDDGAMSEETEL